MSSPSTKAECLAELKEMFGRVFLAVCAEDHMREEQWQELMSKTGSDTAWEDVVEALLEMKNSAEAVVREAVGEVDIEAGMTKEQYVALNTHQLDSIPDVPLVSQVYPEVRSDVVAALEAVGATDGDAAAGGGDVED